jgi:nucleotide-binding universal stress UspA family protein
MAIQYLCPTDFSEPSKRALSHAIGLAKRHEGEITVLHVAPLLPRQGGFPPYINPITLEPIPREQLLHEIDRFAEPARQAGIRASAALEEGDPAHAILAFAASNDTDVLIIGTHGRSGFERWVLGSVTEKVVRKAECPVLSIPARAAVGAGEGEYRRIVCPIDFSESSLSALDRVAMFAGPDVRVCLVHVLEWFPEQVPAHLVRCDLDEYRRFLECDARDRLASAIVPALRSGSVELRVAKGKAASEILRVADDERADLIAMGVHGRGAVDRMIFGSTSHRVVREAACPVLSVRGHKG